MATLRELEKRIKALEDIEEIKKLKARYFRALDHKLWDVFADVYTEDAIGDYGPVGYWRGRKEIAASSEKYEGPSYIINTHQGHNPEIDLTGENTAKGKWELSYSRTDTRTNTVMRDSAYYEEEYRRCDDGKWRISKLTIRSFFPRE